MRNPVDHVQRTLEATYRFLGLPAHRHRELRALNSGGVYERMHSQSRAQPVEYFRPHNRHVRELTGIDFGWEH